MISVYLQEQKRYTQKELITILENSKIEPIAILRKLKEYGILKMVKTSVLQRDMTDLAKADEELTPISIGNEDFYYVVTFVGVITVAGIILKCYPKYIQNNTNPKNELKQILKVVERYNKKEQIIKLFNENNNETTFNLLAVFIFLINDYYENGIYTNPKNIIEINGSGEITWDKTINDTFALISKNRPYYPEIKTIKTINDDNNYIKRLHECVLTQVSYRLQEAEILDLFDITPVYLSDETIDDFGDTDYILYRIEKELNAQFNTRKQILLKMIYAYIYNKCSMDDIDCFSMFGTNSFNMLWEKVCAEVFDNMLDKELGQIELPVPLGNNYKKHLPLKSIIDKPYWSFVDKHVNDTLIPDIITVCNNNGIFKFIILDAKYYTPKLEQDQKIEGQPGIESITKQYLYQLAFKQFIKDHKINDVENYFILPTSDDVYIDKGYVSLSILQELGLSNIKIKYLPAKEIFRLYLNRERINICNFF